MNAHAEKDDSARADRSRRFLEQLVEAKKDPIACLVVDRETSAACEALDQALAHIDARKDCSDFKAHLLLRACRLPQAAERLPQALRARIRTALLDLPYRDFAPDNRMLHRSENHRLCFLTAELLAAETWPEAAFTSTGRPAREHFHQARNDLADWTRWVGTYGSSEWDSSTYYAIDLLSLLDVYDFSTDEPSRRRARWVLDKLVLDIALKSFRGVYGGSQGRCYANALLNPRQCGTANVLLLLFGVGDPSLEGGGLLSSFLATSAYRPPEVIGRIAASGETMLHRQRHRGDDRYYPPPDVPHAKNLNLYSDVNTVTYREATGMLASAQDLRPGESDRQVQVWQATLSPEIAVFANHPGDEGVNSAATASFWTGCARLPRVFQHEASLLALYADSAGAGLPYTHAHFPSAAFDERASDSHWAAGRLGDAYVGLRCSSRLTPAADGPWAGRELRAEAGAAAWACELSCRKRTGSFEAFVASLREAPLAFDAGALRAEYRSPQAGALVLGWTDAALREGNAVELAHFPHHDGPFAKGEFGSGVVELKCGGATARLALDT